MKNSNELLEPNQIKHYRDIARDELTALRVAVIKDWKWIAFSLVAFIVSLYFINPLPPSKVTLASGQPNSSLHIVGTRLQKYFEEAGVELALIQSNGAVQSLQLLENNKVDAALSQGGLSTSADEISSLGSVNYMPVWFFYRGQLLDHDPRNFLETKKISVNLKGSGTNRLVNTILAQHELLGESHPNFIELSSGDSTKALLNGSIDGMFLVAGFESENLQKLLNAPGIEVYDFPFAPAYERRVDFLDHVTVPRGSIDLNPIVPKKNIDMPATTTVVLVNDDLHPAIQYLFLKSMSEMDDEYKPFFTRSAGFPAYTDRTIPQSLEAKRFYEHGKSPIDRYVPFWMASLADRAWFYLLAFIAVVFPLLSIVPRYRLVNFQLSLQRAYTHLNDIEQALQHSETLAEVNLINKNLRQLSIAIKKLWIPTGGQEAYYQLMQAFGVIQSEIDSAIRYREKA